jgi:hypothetical protein
MNSQHYGSQGGKQLVATYGRGHMAAIGRRGGETFRQRCANLIPCTVYLSSNTPYVIQHGQKTTRRIIRQTMYRLGGRAGVVFVLTPLLFIEWDDQLQRPEIEQQLTTLITE